MTDIFGRIFAADELENAALTILKLWFPTYLAEFKLQRTLPSIIPAPKSYLTVDKVDKTSIAQLPSIVVISPGLAGKQPKREGDGSFNALFTLGVGVFVAANDRTNTMNLTRWYTSIARMIILQHADLGDISSGVTWLDETYDPEFDFRDDQTIGCGTAIFEVLIQDVGNGFAGPVSPIPDPDMPGSEWPTATTVTAIVEVED